MTINELYNLRLKGEGGAVHSDILEHMPLLRGLASGVDTVIEFGSRTGNSTVAFLAGLAERRYGGLLYSYDIESHPNLDGIDTGNAKWIPLLKSSLVQPGETHPADLIMFDSLHSYYQVDAELERWGHLARRYLVFHDVTLFATKGELGCELGIVPAILKWLANATTRYGVKWYPNNNGLLVLERLAG